MASLGPNGLKGAWKVYWHCLPHYSDVIMSAMTSQITSFLVGCSTICSGAGQKKKKLHVTGFVREFHLWLVDFPHKGTVTRKMFPFDDVILIFQRPHGALSRDPYLRKTKRPIYPTWSMAWLFKSRRRNKLGYQQQRYWFKSARNQKSENVYSMKLH